MKKITTIVSLFIIVLTTSCEKVIDIEINETDKKYVIEGEVSTNASIASIVKLSKTKSFNEDNSFAGVSSAIVTIQENNGTVYPLTPIAEGVYTNSTLVGKWGSTYTLSVTIAGNTFTAQSKMPNHVNLDTLTAETFSFGGNNTINIKPSYKDPIGLGNSYRFIQYRNGNLVRNIFVQNDAISDGRTITRPLINRDSELKSGDLVTVVMQCIDEEVYKYWYSLEQAATGNSQATPANPITNIKGGAIGVFSANTYSTKSIIIP